MDVLHRETESDHENNRDWSDLSPDLVRLVSRNLFDIFDFVRFRTVCKHWRSAALASDHHRPLLPCLFGRKSNYFLLYSLPFGETHKINFPNPQGMINFPEPRHWIFTGSIEHPILAGNNIVPTTLSLINPLTKNEVVLPLINGYCFPRKCIGLKYPTETWEHIAVHGYAGYSNTQYLALYRHGEGKWVTIEKNLTGRYPIVYYKGMYYCFNNVTQATEVIHMITGEIMSTIPPPQTYDSYYLDEHFFVESAGDLLLVCKLQDYQSNSTFLIKFHIEIYRLKQENDDRLWVKMSNIADRALFLESSGGFSVRATDFDRLKSNCVYYIEFALSTVKNPNPGRYVMRYDIEDRCWEELPYPSHQVMTWIMPSTKYLLD